MDNLDYLQILQISKKFFKARDRTSEEVRSFLVSKGISIEVVEDFIKEAIHRGLLDDKRVFENSLDLALATKKKGPNRILHEFLERGFDEAKIMQSMEEIPKDVVRENCKFLIEKRILTKSPSKKEIFNCIQMLIQKGYEEEMVFSLFREINIQMPLEYE
jgi:SOS response regulatory protein OraA/RecX